MEAVNAITVGGIIVDIIIVCMIIVSAFLGYRRGLTSVIFKLLASVIALIMVVVVYKPVANLIIEKTQFDESLTSAIKNSIIGAGFTEGATISLKNPIMTEKMTEFLNSFVQEALRKAEADAIGYASAQLAYLTIRVITLVVLYSIIRFLLMFIRVAGEIIGNLPIIKTFNKSGGLLYGTLKALIIAYLILAVISLVAPFINELGIIKAIQESYVGNPMYNNNIILNIFM